MPRDIEDHLILAQDGLRQLRQRVNRLENDNSRLRSELASTSQPKQSGNATDDDTNLEELSALSGVENLEQMVSRLNKEKSRLQKEIEDLRRSLLEEEVDNLQTATGEGIDPAYRMRKLLRRFSDLMLVAVLSDDGKEECPICYEPFKLKKCSALGCGHLICQVCLPSISRAATKDTEKLRCPECRQETPREELELVHMTETNRWDKLLKVAQAWMAFDKRGELETSEEEDEEDFITDGNGTSKATTEAETEQSMDDAPVQGEIADLEQGVSEQYSPSPPAAGPLFSDSPTKLKRKRMEELATERSQRRWKGSNT